MAGRWPRKQTNFDVHIEIDGNGPAPDFTGQEAFCILNATTTNGASAPFW